ncbi:hypothetical protein [Hyalangium minutum]|uniref:hypothetical protein n=1 Tax=Hyalangium minutum TaxID=394096 RepID=UPI0012F70B5E|nr:hypothetical protein [Hyalangium minutum]
MTERDITVEARRPVAAPPLALVPPLPELPSPSEPPMRPQGVRPVSQPRPVVVDDYDDSMWEEGLASW